MDDLQTAQRQLERYRLSVLQAAVEGRLTADWRRTHAPEPADRLLGRILEKRREQWEEHYRWSRYDSSLVPIRLKVEGAPKRMEVTLQRRRRTETSRFASFYSRERDLGQHPPDR